MCETWATMSQDGLCENKFWAHLDSAASTLHGAQMLLLLLPPPTGLWSLSQSATWMGPWGACSIPGTLPKASFIASSLSPSHQGGEVLGLPAFLLCWSQPRGMK